MVDIVVAGVLQQVLSVAAIEPFENSFDTAEIAVVTI